MVAPHGFQRKKSTTFSALPRWLVCSPGKRRRLCAHCPLSHLQCMLVAHAEGCCRVVQQILLFVTDWQACWLASIPGQTAPWTAGVSQGHQRASQKREHRNASSSRSPFFDSRAHAQNNPAGLERNKFSTATVTVGCTTRLGHTLLHPDSARGHTQDANTE